MTYTCNLAPKWLKSSGIAKKNVRKFCYDSFNHHQVLAKKTEGGKFAPLQFFSYNSETVKANFAKFSDIIYLAIPLDLSRFGARMHV